MLNIGFVGLTASSWAAAAHLPAVQALSELYVVSGVANSSPESSKASITHHQLTGDHAYENVTQLCRSPSVNLIIISVKVPYHKMLIETALKESKPVFSEWPLRKRTKGSRRATCTIAAKVSENNDWSPESQIRTSIEG